MRSTKLWVGLLATLLVASLVAVAALWVHREDVFASACQGMSSALEQLYEAGGALQRDPSPAGQQQAAYLVAQAVGEIDAVSPIVAQEGFGNSSVLSLGEGLQIYEGNLQGGAEPRQLVERQAHTLLTLPSDVSRTYRTDSTLGREFLTKLNVVSHQLVDGGIVPKQ